MRLIKINYLKIMNLIPIIVKTVLQLLAGVGIGAVLDKVAGDKLPNYPAEGVLPKNEAGQLHLPKLIYWVVAGVIGALAWNFVSKKLKI